MLHLMVIARVIQWVIHRDMHPDIMVTRLIIIWALVIPRMVITVSGPMVVLGQGLVIMGGEAGAGVAVTVEEDIGAVIGGGMADGSKVDLSQFYA
jgi:hypothetical protein